MRGDPARFALSSVGSGHWRYAKRTVLGKSGSGPAKVMVPPVSEGITLFQRADRQRAPGDHPRKKLSPDIEEKKKTSLYPPEILFQ